MAMELVDDVDDDPPADRCWEHAPYHPYLRPGPESATRVSVVPPSAFPLRILGYVGGIWAFLAGIQDSIVSKAMCVCGVTNVLADDLPNQTLRNTISRILESMTSSTENAGSLVHVTDMESACNIQPKVPSPTLSAASKDERKLHLLNEYTLGAKECEVASEGKAENVAAHSSERKAAKATDPSEATQDSASAKEPISLENAPVPEETQEKLPGGEQGKKKKKKKTRFPVSAAADMQWRAFQDFGAENFSGMPLGSSAFNPYWAGGMPLGMDGYMVPFPGAMPYMGYPPGPFDVPFGGVLPQDPFAGQGYMVSGVPQRENNCVVALEAKHHIINKTRTILLHSLETLATPSPRQPKFGVEFYYMKDALCTKNIAAGTIDSKATTGTMVHHCQSESQCC